MADLEGAGGETLTHLKDLVEQIDRAHQKFTSLGEKVSDVASQVQDDWARLGEQVGSFLEAVAEQQGRLSTEVQEAAQALSQLGGAVAEAQGEAAGELDGAHQEVTGFADRYHLSRRFRRLFLSVLPCCSPMMPRFSLPTGPPRRTSTTRP